MDFWASPLALMVDSLMDEGRNIWVWGISTDGARALIVDRDNDRVSIARSDCGTSLGRWECSTRHLGENTGVYAERFPWDGTGS
jgi:hypothetical protein